jgi:signal transduction histidine kinase
MRLKFPSVLAVFWGLALWLGAATTAAAASLADGCASATRIEQALREVTLNGSLIDSAVVTIPDKLSRDWRREGIKIRYTIAVDDCGTAGEQTIWLPRVGGPYQFRVQDRAALPVHPFIALDAPEVDSDKAKTFNGRASMLFRIPPATSRVSVEIQTLPYIPSGIPNAERGPFTVMIPLQMRSYNEQSGGMNVISLITGFIGMIAIVLWRARPMDRYILWFGLMCFAWGVRGYISSSDEVWFSPLVFELINPFVLVFFPIGCLQTTLLLLNRSITDKHKKFLIAAGALLASFALSLIAERGADAVRLSSYAFCMFLLFYTAYTIWNARYQFGMWRAALLAAGFCALIGASVHDILMIAGAISSQRNSWALVGFTTLLLAYAIVCAHFVIRTLNQSEASNELLELRVREKTQELAHSYEKLRSFEVTQAQAQERERLLRDMHDGVGAQLMTALRGLERGVLDKDAIANALQDGLDDLRMLMDNADPQSTFADRLAAWRSRWDARLGLLGIQLHWQLGDDLDELTLSGDTALQLLRVVQEACTNVIKHAHATAIWLTAKRSIRPAGEALFIEVRDNGQGFSNPPLSASRRGLANMRFRAKQIGAELAIEPPPLPANGCCVRLWLPLPGRTG